MPLDVIGFGLGRSGTYSTKLALEQLGFGPCHHMEEVDPRSREQLALWMDAAGGKVDWERAYAGYRAALDWPTAGFCRELVSAFPKARFLLTVRDPEKWYKSISETIYPLVQATDRIPGELLPFLGMVRAVMQKTGFVFPATKTQIMAAHDAHMALVKSAVPEDQLLIFDVRQGWNPLCDFLGVPAPETPFPQTNNTQDFWNSVQAG